MDKVINGIEYDTDSEKLIATAPKTMFQKDYFYGVERLYLKSTGEYFLYINDVPFGDYTQCCVTGGYWDHENRERIIPLSVNSAKKWGKKRLDKNTYKKVFHSRN